MSKRREIRQMLFQAKQAIPATPENEELLAKITETMLQLRSAPESLRENREMKIPPYKKGEPPHAIVQFKLFPLTEEICYNSLMFDTAESFWRYVMEQGQGKRALQVVTRDQHYIMPAEMREYLAAGGKIQRPVVKEKLTEVATKSLEDMGL